MRPGGGGMRCRSISVTGVTVAVTVDESVGGAAVALTLVTAGEAAAMVSVTTRGKLCPRSCNGPCYNIPLIVVNNLERKSYMMLGEQIRKSYMIEWKSYMMLGE